MFVFMMICMERWDLAITKLVLFVMWSKGIGICLLVWEPKKKPWERACATFAHRFASHASIDCITNQQGFSMFILMIRYDLNDWNLNGTH